MKAVRRYAGDDVGFVFDPAGPATSPLIGGLDVVERRGGRGEVGDAGLLAVVATDQSPPGGGRLNVGDGDFYGGAGLQGPRVRRRCPARIRRSRRVRGSPSGRSVRAARRVFVPTGSSPRSPSTRSLHRGLRHHRPPRPTVDHLRRNLLPRRRKLRKQHRRPRHSDLPPPSNLTMHATTQEKSRDAGSSSVDSPRRPVTPSGLLRELPAALVGRPRAGDVGLVRGSARGSTEQGQNKGVAVTSSRADRQPRHPRIPLKCRTAATFTAAHCWKRTITW